MVELKEAAERLGVHYQTAYRWVRTGELRAHKIGTTYSVDEADVVNFLEERNRPTAPPSKTQVRNWEHQQTRFSEFLLSGKEIEARAMVLRLFEGGVEVVDICEYLFSPVLFQIGEFWAEGSLTIAEEHRASAICERTLAALMQNPRGRPRGVAVIGTPPGDEHSLPSAMATAVLRSLRWQVHHLGTQVPPKDFLKLVTDVGADLVVISVTHPSALPEGEVIEDLVSRAGIRVMMGGPGTPLRSLADIASRRV